MQFSDEALRGKTVIAADGHAIGEILSLWVNGDTWRVDALEIALRREIADRIGAHRSVFRAGKVEVPIHLVQSVGDALILKVNVEALATQTQTESAQP